MIIHVLTLYPEMLSQALNHSIMRRALAERQVELRLIQIRDFTKDKYGRVDTPPIGGGAGLVLKAQPILDALQSISNPGPKILLTPRGQTYQQSQAQALSKLSSMTLICGHFEGFDERIYHHVDQIVSIGDYILTGGEIAALAIIDSVTRLLPGVIKASSIVEESFHQHLLEYPQYTEPYEFLGEKVPDILYSGNHKAIHQWRMRASLFLTRLHRPDLFAKINLTKQQLKLLDDDTGKQPQWEIEAIEKGKRFIKK
jgi:tRNA (guanine37-N1)-methyltransferase